MAACGTFVASAKIKLLHKWHLWLLTKHHLHKHGLLRASSSFSVKPDINAHAISINKRKLKQSSVLEEYFPKHTRLPYDGKRLEDFVTNNARTAIISKENDGVPYIQPQSVMGDQRKVFFEVTGCQMNVSDTEIAWSILEENGFVKTNEINNSDVILVMTCAVREGAEQKIWERLNYFKHLKKLRRLQKGKPHLKIGILGCMAERLKHEIVEKEKLVDVVCGPDAYRDLPRLLAQTSPGQASVNVLLSLEETYADVIPTRINQESPTAYVSIMRGCDNMCTYCIVPFTRGRERSRPVNTIVEEIKRLSDQGVKEVTLLGQNVNSYRDISEVKSFMNNRVDQQKRVTLSRGFKTIYKPKVKGLGFADLLDKVSQVDPEMRIRYTSPHPKDFPDEVLQLILDRPNICNQLHLPAQSGSNRVLESMRRGYTREAYLDLVHHIRDMLPEVSLSSDFISGFCGETEEDHQDTLSLLREVKYNFVFCFPYSMRKKTTAYHRLHDDIPEDIKSVRHMEVTKVFREEALKLNKAQIGKEQLVLIEGASKRNPADLFGRNDGFTKVIVRDGLESHLNLGDYVVVQIEDASSQVLIGKALHTTTLRNYHSQKYHKYNNI